MRIVKFSDGKYGVERGRKFLWWNWKEYLNIAIFRNTDGLTQIWDSTSSAAPYADQYRENTRQTLEVFMPLILKSKYKMRAAAKFEVIE